jgi:hypothetical protein
MRRSILAVAMLVCSPAFAQSYLLHVHGRALDGADQPIGGAGQVTISLYNQKEGGTAPWSDTFSVTFFGGMFAVSLGAEGQRELTRADVTGPKWLSFKVNADPEMTPRLPLGYVPYAVTAIDADSAAHADMADALAPTATVPASQVSGKVAAAANADSADVADALSLTATVPAAQITGKVAQAAAADTADSAADADTLGGHAPSASAAAGAVPFLDSGGKLALAMIPGGINAATVGGIAASATPQAGSLVALDSNGKLPDSTIPTGKSGASMLRASFDFEEGSGTTSADASGAGNALTLAGSGVGFTPQGHSGKALNFFGGSATAAASPSLDLGSSASVEAWVFVPAAVAGTMTVAAREGAWRLALVNMNVQASFETLGGPAGALAGSGAVSANAWNHIAVTYDGLVVRTFVNGRLGSETAYANGPIKASTGLLYVGGLAATDFFNGKIDELRVAQSALRFPGRPSGNVYCGLSTATTGNLGGWTGARASCVTACGGTVTAHMCDASEIARSWQYGAALPAGGAWVGSVTAVASVSGGTGGSAPTRSDVFTGYAGCCSWTTNSTAVTSVTFPSAASGTSNNNCTGWTGTGSAQIAKTNNFDTSACSASLPIACCD